MEQKSSVNEPMPPAQEFLKNLRLSTDELHQKLESLPLSASLMKDDVTADDYAFYLACMKDVMSFYDDVVLKEVSGIIPGAEGRKKLPSLISDLDYLKTRGVESRSVSPLKQSTIGNISIALGMAYVIEGSTLGGRVILRHVRERLRILEGGGTAFFGGYDANTGAMWKEFLNALTAYAVEHESNTIIEGAVDGFKMIYHHFLENGTSR